MLFSKFLRILILSSFLFVLHLSAYDQSLKTQDVTKIMKQIFDQHVDEKEMSSKILKHSFKVYFDQFDPDRIYLLKDEVQPFIDLSDAAMSKIMEQYKQNEFPEYRQINDVIQKAIVRSRQIRSEIEKDHSQLFKSSAAIHSDGEEDWRDPDLKRPFSKDETELKERIKQQILLFIAGERKRFGDKMVMNHKSQTLALYENHVRNLENQYLFENDLKQPLPAAISENLFVMHVLKSLANSLDAHTTFYSSNEAYDMKVRLEKELQGIGVILKKNSDGTVVVNRILDGSPAAKTGLVKVQDLVEEIDGSPIKDESYDKIMEMLRGKVGTPINLKVQRMVDEHGGKITKTLNVVLKRDVINVNEDRVDSTYLPYGNGIIGIITLHSFYQGENGINSENDVQEAIKKLDAKGNLRGLILDFRENSGGFLSQAVKVAGLFITNGVVVTSKYFNGEEHIYRDMDSKAAYTGPLIILTSKATASAAEIVAQALQDYGIALVVGDERTYGKGTIQSQTVTENQASTFFKVTVGKYYTVSGKTPQIQGVKADIVAPSPFLHENIGEEYLNFPLKQDTIVSAYDDKLGDIEPNLKPWYMRYYVPTLQHKVDQWKQLLPVLKKNSEQRIANNIGYQKFIKNIQIGNDHDLDDPSEVSHANQVDSPEAMQLTEAVNIMKDMIVLDTQMHHNNTAENSSGRAAILESSK